MATFRQNGGNFQFTFIDHSNTGINFDIRNISGDNNNFGNVAPGTEALSNAFFHSGTLEFGNVAVVGIGQFGQPQLAPAPGVRFHSGFDFPVGEDQYINLLAGDGWTVTQDNVDLCEVTGNGFRITVDGGGVNDPTTANIFFQVYNA